MWLVVITDLDDGLVLNKFQSKSKPNDDPVVCCI